MRTNFEIQRRPVYGIPTVGTIGRFTGAWSGALGFWAVGAGTAVALLMSYTPIFKHDVLSKIPVLNSFYEDNTPSSDKPF